MLFGIIKHTDSNFILIDTYSTSAFGMRFWKSVSKSFQIKYIPILHGGNLPQRLTLNPFISRMIFKNAFVNVSPSEYLKYNFETFGIKNVICIPNAITLKDYSFKVRNNFAPNLIWVRAFAAIYNPKMAIEVLHELQKSYPKATLTMIGPDKDGSFEITKQYAKQLQVTVNFKGKLSKKNGLI